MGRRRPRVHDHISLAHGRVVVGRRLEARSYRLRRHPARLGSGPGAVSMLCDLFVHPEVHGSGCGRAMLAALWPGTGG